MLPKLLAVMQMFQWQLADDIEQCAQKIQQCNENLAAQEASFQT
jgi:hypothetical protein